MTANVGLSPRVIFILVTVLLDTIGMGLVRPIVPRLLQAMAGGSASDASYAYGLFQSAYASAMFACAPLLGKLSDRYGRRPVLLLALGTSAATYVLAATTTSVALLIAAQLVNGACGASFATAGAYVADLTPPDKRSQSFGSIGAVVAAGIMLGPIAGGLLAEYGLRVPFWAAAAVMTFDVLYGLFVLPESLPVAQRRLVTIRGLNPAALFLRLKQLNVSPRLTMAAALLLLASSVAQSVSILFMQVRIGWTPTQVGIYVTAAAAAVAIGQAGLIRVFMSRFGERRTAGWGVVMRVVGAVLFGLVSRGWQMYALLAFVMLGSVTQPTLVGAMSRAVSSREQGQFQGAITSLGIAAEALGALVGASVFGYFTRPGVWWFVPGAGYFLTALLCGMAWGSIAGPLPRRRVASGRLRFVTVGDGRLDSSDGRSAWTT